jgi:hypothetical protein
MAMRQEACDADSCCKSAERDSMAGEDGERTRFTPDPVCARRSTVCSAFAVLHSFSANNSSIFPRMNSSPLAPSQFSSPYHQ